jgi:RNA polymerase sigma factor FliA
MLRSPNAKSALENITLDTHVEAALWHKLIFEGDNSARADIFSRYSHFARRLARFERSRRPKYGLDIEDFEQLAFEGLIKAIDQFDPGRGTPFEAYARLRIRGVIADGHGRSSEEAALYTSNTRQLRDRIRSLQNGPTQKNKGALEELTDLVVGLAIGLFLDGPQGETNHDLNAKYVQAHYNGEALKDLEGRVQEIVLTLDDPARQVIQLHYRDGVSFKQISALKGVTKGRVSQIHREALREIQRLIKDAGDS